MIDPAKIVLSSGCVSRLWLLASAFLVTIAMPVATAGATESGALPHSPVVRVDRDLLLGFLADNTTMTLIDARSSEEYTEQHLPGAINVPFDAVDSNADRLPADTTKPVVVYCRTGYRAGQLREQLIARGYDDVRLLPREQIHWKEDFMVFNCSTESAAASADATARVDTTD
jgi:rhodanese-related sulfurtransferase